jgi:hypothetical protein
MARKTRGRSVIPAENATQPRGSVRERLERRRREQQRESSNDSSLPYGPYLSVKTFAAVGGDPCRLI